MSKKRLERKPKDISEDISKDICKKQDSYHSSIAFNRDDTFITVIIWNLTKK